MIYKVGDTVVILKSTRVSNPQYYNQTALISSVSETHIVAEMLHIKNPHVWATIEECKTCMRHVTPLEKLL